jgi:hypothetical protein
MVLRECLLFYANLPTAYERRIVVRKTLDRDSSHRGMSLNFHQLRSRKIFQEARDTRPDARSVSVDMPVEYGLHHGPALRVFEVQGEIRFKSVAILESREPSLVCRY